MCQNGTKMRCYCCYFFSKCILTNCIVDMGRMIIIQFCVLFLDVKVLSLSKAQKT